MAGGSIEKLKEILGHYSVIVTERYARLRPDLFPASDFATIALDMSPRDPPPGPQRRRQTGIQAPDRASQAPASPRERPEPPCKPGSVPPEDRRWRTFIWDARCRAPRASRTRRLGRAARHPASRRGRLPICSCTGWGLPCRPRHRGRGALLPHRFTLTTRASRRRSAVCSLWHFPAGRPDRPLAGTLPCGARTFLGGLSADAYARAAPASWI